MLTSLVRALAGVDPDRAVRLAADAEQTAHSVTSTYHQAEALRELATALVEARLWDRAEQVARSLTWPSDQAQPLLVLMNALAKAGLWERAERTAHSITDPDHQVKALSTIASAFAEAGLWEQAEQAADSIINSEARARTHANIAKTACAWLPERPDQGHWLRSRAHRNLVAALAEGEWLAAMPAMAKLDPLAVIAVYEALCAVSL